MVRYFGRHGEDCIAKTVLLGAVVPHMLQTKSNPNGLPMSVFDSIRAAATADRSQYFKDLTTPFFGSNREGIEVSQGMRDAFWFIGMQNGLKNELNCIAAFSETGFLDDMNAITSAVLVLHGDDDRIVPFDMPANARPNC